MATRRIGRIVLASVVSVIGSALLAAPAGAAFSAPVDLVGANAANPQVATDANGDSAIAWEITGLNDVQARTVSSAGVLGPVLDLSVGAGNADIDVHAAIDSLGNTVFVWNRITPGDPGIIMRRLSATGTLGPASEITFGIPGGFSDPQVATDSNGDTVFTWNNGGRVQAKTMTSRGVLGSLRNVSPVNEAADGGEVASDATGDSVITWELDQGGDGDNDVVQARTISVNGSLGPVLAVSAPGQRAFAPQVATDGDGDTKFAWLRFDGNRDRVQARTMSAGGVLGTITNITSSGPSAIAPQVATDVDGDSALTWERHEGGFDRAQARTMSDTSVLGAITNLSSTGGEAFGQQVASAASGASAYTWLRFDGTVDRVQARTMNAAGTFAGVVDLSAAGVDAEAPQVAMAATTAAIVVTWERAGAIQFSKGP